MPALFLSQASEDDAATSALEAWLLANGFTDIFVDHHSFAGGEKWREALRASAGACRVVVCQNPATIDGFNCSGSVAVDNNTCSHDWSCLTPLVQQLPGAGGA